MIRSYTDLHSFDNFFREDKFTWLSSKSKVADKNLHFRGTQHKLSCQFQFQKFFSSTILFLKSNQLIFFLQITRQMIAGQYKINSTNPSKMLQYLGGQYFQNFNFRVSNLVCLFGDVTVSSEPSGFFFVKFGSYHRLNLAVYLVFTEPK